jgi:sugar lactone lactonase YvrE
MVFISDSAKNVIYRFAGERIEEWFKGPEIRSPNGLLVLKDKVIIGNNGDITLKTVRKDTREVENIVSFKSGVIDGIQIDADGNLLVSMNEGKIFRITPSGEIIKLLDTSAQAVFCADFVFVPEKNMLVVPTFLDNRVVSFKYQPGKE